MLDLAKKDIAKTSGAQIHSKLHLDALYTLAEAYFAQNGNFGVPEDLIGGADELFRTIHQLSRKRPSKSKCITSLNQARKFLVLIEGSALSLPQRPLGQVTRVDELITSSLDDLCPPAAASYRQGLRDLSDTERHSWRGTAAEFRESLRETLDKLAPDADVEAAPSYKTEQDAKRPTMKQKARYILKNRGLSANQIASPEDAIRIVEDSLSGLTRSVYTLSSISTHTPATREEVARIHVCVRIVLCELLSVPHQ